MDPLLAAALGLGSAGAQWGLGAISSARQMRFQERMSSTAHQREVADLRAAGLNPVLSASGGAGASTPMGATWETPDMGSSVMQAMRLREELASVKQARELEKKMKDAEFLNVGATYENLVESKKEITARTKLLEAQRQLMEGGVTAKLLGTGVTAKLKRTLEETPVPGTREFIRQFFPWRR